MPLDDSWMIHALCKGADVNIFFPKSEGKGVRVDASEAKAYCYSCPVRKTCLAWAIAHRIPDGVWGGMTKSERDHIPSFIRQEVRRLWFERHPLAKPVSNAIGTYLGKGAS